MEPVTIISAELKELDFHSNVERTTELRLELLKMGYSIVGAKVNGLQGFIVTTDKYKPLVKLAVKYGQETIYVTSEDRETTKIDCLKPKSKVVLGKLLKQTKQLKIDSRDKLTVSFIEDGKQHVFSTEL